MYIVCAEKFHILMIIVFLKTGSLLSIRKNTKDILIPSEEHKISMYPMDFEEFLWAIGDEISADTIRMLLQKKKPAGNVMHRNFMRIFRLYMAQQISFGSRKI